MHMAAQGKQDKERSYQIVILNIVFLSEQLFIWLKPLYIWFLLYSVDFIENHMFSRKPKICRFYMIQPNMG